MPSTTRNIHNRIRKNKKQASRVQYLDDEHDNNLLSESEVLNMSDDNEFGFVDLYDEENQVQSELAVGSPGVSFCDLERQKIKCESKISEMEGNDNPGQNLTCHSM